MKTFKELQDEVLDWMADSSDTGLLRELVKAGINRGHTRILTQTQWDFMLWPKTETISVTADKTAYTLHPLFFSPLYFYNPTTDEYLEEITQRDLMESEQDWQDGETSEPERFSLTTVTGLSAQPEDAGVVSVLTSGGSESSSNGVVIRGIVDGVEVEEVLQSASSWTTLTGTSEFSHIISVTKIGSSWTHLIGVVCDGTTVLALFPGEFGKQFRQFELLANPTASATILYRFLQRPRELSRDNDIPQIPQEFSEILVYDTLLKMQGYARHTGDEMALFKLNYDELWKGLSDNYKLTRSVGSRPKFVRHIPRL